MSSNISSRPTPAERWLTEHAHEINRNDTFVIGPIHTLNSCIISTEIMASSEKKTLNELPVKLEDEKLTIGVEMIYCCQKTEYIQYIISTDNLSSEQIEFIKGYDGDYFQEDCQYQTISISTPLDITKEQYNKTDIKKTNVVC